MKVRQNALHVILMQCVSILWDLSCVTVNQVTREMATRVMVCFQLP